MTYHLEAFDPDASRIQLKAMEKSEIDMLLGLPARGNARSGSIGSSLRSRFGTGASVNYTPIDPST